MFSPDISALYWWHTHLQWDSLLNKGNLACTAQSAYLSQTLLPPSLLPSCFLTTSLHPWSRETHHPPNVHPLYNWNKLCIWLSYSWGDEGEREWKKGAKEKQGKEASGTCISMCFSKDRLLSTVHLRHWWSGVILRTVRFTSSSKDSSEYFFFALACLTCAVRREAHHWAPQPSSFCLIPRSNKKTKKNTT